MPSTELLTAGKLPALLRIFENPAAAAAALAAEVEARLRRGLEGRGAASLLVSGGRTPAPFLAALARADLDWPRVGVSLADERWVEPASPDSNERLVREQLATGAARAAVFVPLKAPGADPASALEERAAALAVLPRPFDAVVLGMGDDGHTASLFPGASGLETALDPLGAPGLVSVAPPAAPHLRLSWNLAGLLDSRWIAVLIQGEGKRAVLQRALEASALEMPIAAVLRQGKVPVEVYWAE